SPHNLASTQLPVTAVIERAELCQPMPENSCRSVCAGERSQPHPPLDLTLQGLVGNFCPAYRLPRVRGFSFSSSVHICLRVCGSESRREPDPLFVCRKRPGTARVRSYHSVIKQIAVLELSQSR